MQWTRATVVQRTAALFGIMAPCILGLSACSGGGESPPPIPPPPVSYSSAAPTVGTPVPTTRPLLPPPSTPSSTTLEQYRNSCTGTVSSYFRGKLDFQPSLKAVEGKTTTYDAAVDVRTKPPPPSEVLNDPKARGETVTVQCQVAARLDPVGSGITVRVPNTTTNADDDGGWRYKQLNTAVGLVQWSWDVTPTEPGDQRLRLEIRPAVVGDTAATVSTTDTIDKTIPVAVDSTTIQRASNWFTTSWHSVEVIAGILGGAAAGLLAFSTQVRDAARKLFRPTDKATTPSDTTKSRDRGLNRPPPQKTKGASRR